MTSRLRVLARSLTVVGLVITTVGVADAQQTCLAPTPTAKEAVTGFLQDPDEVAWLRAHEITATDASELRPLSDAADAALCRRIDSRFASRPVYYFAAGSYVIGTIATPIDAHPGRLENREFARDIFVFDTAGTWIHSPGERYVIAPPDLHAATAIEGRLVLQWTNRSTDIASYQMQRAVGAGTFVNLGSPLSGSATTFTDVSALGGNAYRYHLLARSASGDSSFSNDVRVTLADIGAVSRTSTGLLYRDQFDRPDGAPGADWVIESGGWAIVNNALQITLSSQSLTLRLAALPNRRDYHVQVLTSRSQLATYAPIQVRKAFNLMYQADLGSTSEGNVPRLYRLAGWWTGIGVGSMRSVANTQYRMTLSAIGNSIRLWANGTRQVTGTDALGGWDAVGHFAFNAYSSGATGTIRYDDLVICSDRTVTITGLPAGYRLRVASSVSDPAGSTGSVSVDLFGTQLPVAQLEILDASGAAVEIHAPANGVWGGDRYSLNGAS